MDSKLQILGKEGKSGFSDPDDAGVIGTLELKVREAKLYLNREEDETISPFFVIEHNFKKYKTPVIRDSNLNPKWKDDYLPLLIPIKSGEAPINFFCYDKDLILDEFLGLSTF